MATSFWPQVSGTRITGLLYATIWLVFLAAPVIAAVYSPAAVGWKLLAWAATAGFAMLYTWQMACWIGDDAIGRVHPRRLTVICLVLAGQAALTLPASGTWAVCFLPYIAALIIFTTAPQTGIPIGLVIWAVPTAAAYLVTGYNEVWVALGPGFGMLFIIITRLTEHFDERARGAEEQLRAAEERDRIARDVHDVLGHSLTVLSIKAQLARRLVAADPQRADAELGEIEQLARESLEQVRSTVTRLRAPQLPAELEVARSSLTAAGVDVEIRGHSTGDEPGADLMAWTLREAVTNVLRHAQASRCCIQISPERLVISDDGLGVQSSAEGNGLRGLRERAAAIGARVSVGPAEGPGGTRVEVRFP
ncbi:sensor histidine kinase [Nesterenkonia sp.]|uniref:sensor histidine kinase n=1 Tax=Nesterenkonia sp. TaxID=704201 RepID=UPI00262F95C2|nr:sensor histidine kinase [Nesterenkonia sp.]